MHRNPDTMTSEVTGDERWWDVGRRTLRLATTEAGALATVATGLMLAPFVTDTLDDDRAAGQPPVVLVHGLCGDPTNFLPLRRHLARRGVSRFASVSYFPRLDYQRLAARVVERIEAVCRDSGASQVDVVGHSLGGITARYAMVTGATTRIRRLVTLGSPWWAAPNPAEEFAVFADGDAIVPVPPAGLQGHGRSLVIADCGHLGLLTHRLALDAVAGHLRRPVILPGRAARAAA